MTHDEWSKLIAEVEAEIREAGGDPDVEIANALHHGWLRHLDDAIRRGDITAIRNLWLLQRPLLARICFSRPVVH